MGESSEIRPQPGPQTAFLSSPADIAVYGGSAGGGKTFALLLEPLRHVGNPRFGGAIFRRTLDQVRTEGGLWDESGRLYPLLGAQANLQMLRWRFRSGASLRFEHLQHEKDKYQYQGAQFAYLAFDELTHFTESQFFYMLSRNRSTCGVRPYVRATTNPDANSWVKRFLAPWVDARHPEPVASGELRWFVRDGGQILWVPAETPDAKSVTFVRASVFDNRILLERDPGYLANLKALALVDRRRLLDGDWEIVEAGNLFRREWFEIIESTPAGLRLCRHWDLAATAPRPGRDPDWTAGVLMGRDRDGRFTVIDVQRARVTPGKVEALVRQTAEVDRARFGAVAVRLEQEPGSSGLATIDRYRRLVLGGFDFRGVPSTGSKAERARPLAAQAEAGNVRLVRGAWNHELLNELSLFPSPEAHDDQVDAAAGAIECLSRSVPFHAVAGGKGVGLRGLL